MSFRGFLGWNSPLTCLPSVCVCVCGARSNVNAEGYGCHQDFYTLGAEADSTYEYMLKQWILSAGEDEVG